MSRPYHDFAFAAHARARKKIDREKRAGPDEYSIGALKADRFGDLISRTVNAAIAPSFPSTTIRAFGSAMLCRPMMQQATFRKRRKCSRASHEASLVNQLEIDRLKQIEELRGMTNQQALDWAGRDEIKLCQVATRAATAAVRSSR